MVPLTEPQRKVAEYILDHIRETGTPPTLREIAQHLGWKAVGSAQDVVSALRKKGFLAPAEPGKARQLVPASHAEHLLGHPPTDTETSHTRFARPPLGMVQPPTGLLWVPLLGQVPAGTPLEAIEGSGERIPFFFPQATRKDPENFFSLRVEGYSMMNCGFLPGDYLLVEKNKDAHNGDIVVATVDAAEATVKRFAVRGSEIYCRAMDKLRQTRSLATDVPPALLVPENPMFEPLPFGLSEGSRILGLVRALQRPVVS